MAHQTFDEYLADCLDAALAIRTANEKAAAIIARHNAQDMGAVNDFTGRPITQTEYIGLITTFGNMATFWGAGNGTNVEDALTEKPA